MGKSSWTRTIVSYGADQTAHLVVDRFGQLGSVYRETEVERTDPETIITDLMSGRFNDRSVLSPSTRLSIGRGTSQKISRSKSRPAATFKVQAFLSISKSSSPTTPARPGSWPCGSFDRDRRGKKRP